MPSGAALRPLAMPVLDVLLALCVDDVIVFTGPAGRAKDRLLALCRLAEPLIMVTTVRPCRG
ncbi:hypothetical protein [Microbacterium sp. NPDC056052]|uniref:hypothetical protein n=1 Tax=Microbacterium sp. NPDC056052 TaxID=3345695 RepID=UPI0035DB2E0A